jgi:hypothetical protein
VHEGTVADIQHQSMGVAVVTSSFDTLVGHWTLNTCMRIWIMGDSWGDEWGTYSMQGAKPSESLSGTLHKTFDCEVINLCRGGIGNDYALTILKTAINKGETAPTHVIQFWTEPLRDWGKYFQVPGHPTWSVVKAIQKITAIQQQMTKSFREANGNPHWAIIGGQAPITDDHADVIGATFNINDWRSQLLECELDFYAGNLLGSYGSLADYPRNRDRYKTKRKLLDRVTAIIDMQERSKAFPDNAHPGWPEFQPLIENLTAWIRRTL